MPSSNFKILLAPYFKYALLSLLCSAVSDFRLECTQIKREKHDFCVISAHQVSVVNPAMENALKMLQKFASDVREGKVPENRLSFGAPWRHPPRDDNPDLSYKWAKIQLMDFIQSFVNTEFGV
jgi:hypothetical protein